MLPRMTELTRRELLQAMFAAGARSTMPASLTAASIAGASTAHALTAGASARDNAAAALPNTARERLLFDFRWRFHLGHADDPGKDFGFGTRQRTYAKAGTDTADAAQLDFDDRDWEAIDLPHDWAVTLPFVSNPLAPASGEDPAAAHGYKPLGRDFPATSVGWYRRVFEIPAADIGKRVVLEFDGVFRDCIVFCNGHIAARNDSGYVGFEVDVTDLLDYGGRNVVAVRVDATLGEGWFYEGAGIYRHLWLRKNAPLHVPQGGVFVRSELRDGNAECHIVTEVRNDGIDAVECLLGAVIHAPGGSEVARAAVATVRVAAGETRVVEQQAVISAPALWSTTAPQFYRLVTEVRNGDVLHDAVETRFGIRTIAFDAQRGFLLNGAPAQAAGHLQSPGPCRRRCGAAGCTAGIPHPPPEGNWV